MAKKKTRRKTSARRAPARKKTTRRRRKPTAASACRKGFALVAFNPRTGKRYKGIGMCAATRGKLRTHKPRKVAAITPMKIVAVSGTRRRRRR